jgi:SWI/SNF-related matrix-associated actin-dependent regulator 1 of chromatin subfamily A
MKHNGYGFDYTGATNVELLNFLLKSIMIRREKKEVLKDLPPKRREFKYIGIPNKIVRMHEVAEIELSNAVKDYRIRGLSTEERSEKRMLAITALNYLRQVVGMVKAEQTLEIVRPTLETGNKIVIFGHHKAVLDKLEKDIIEAGYPHVRIDGQVTGTKRQNRIDEFQNNPDCKVMIASILAVGMGVDFTSASNVFIVERQWTPAYEEQGEDRLWRLGQGKEVTVWYLVTADTIDDKMNSLIERKRDMLSRIVDGKTPNEESLVKELLGTY